MANNLKIDAKFVKHLIQEEVFMKHFCECISNLEANIVPGFQIIFMKIVPNFLYYKRQWSGS
jgi:hypothetical protein